MRLRIVRYKGKGEQVKKTLIVNTIAGLTIAGTGMAHAQSASALAGPAVPVTVENFVRAESDMYFTGLAK